MDRASFDPEAVRSLEERLLNAWPAERVAFCDGWIFRAARGFTGRANSANAWQPGATPFGTVVAAAESFYASQNLPPRFRLTPLAPPDASDVLLKRGYRAYDDVIVAVRSLDGTERADPGLTASPDPSPAWLDGLVEAGHVRPEHRMPLAGITAAIVPPARFAILTDGAEAAAFGLTVVEGGHAGFFDIAVKPWLRRRGIGARLMRGLLALAHRDGARTAYLQVSAANAPAVALYTGLGFREAYRYTYRVKDEG